VAGSVAGNSAEAVASESEIAEEDEK
jgi:hypothetical protein